MKDFLALELAWGRTRSGHIRGRSEWQRGGLGTPVLIDFQGWVIDQEERFEARGLRAWHQHPLSRGHLCRFGTCQKVGQEGARGKPEQPRFAAPCSEGGAHSEMAMSAGHTFNPSTREAEAGGSLLLLRPSCLSIQADRIGVKAWIRLPAF